MKRLQQVADTLDTISDMAQSSEFEQFRLNANDFISAREHGESLGTQIAQMSATIGEAAEILNRSFPRRDKATRQTTNVISPVVVPKGGRSLGWIVWIFMLAVPLPIVGWLFLGWLDLIPFVGDVYGTIFGWHYWLLLLVYVGLNLWQSSYVMIPDGCQALITQYGKLVAVVGSGSTVLWPWQSVSYIVNTTREYPYNAPIREAPTAGRVQASVDLFLQFRVDDPAEFIFTLGGVHGFAEKLHNAISEVTRALIYEQQAGQIYDLVGESTQPLLESLNRQFLPAVRFVNANITHAEPSSQQYRMDLAAPEMVRVAKEAYTYEYELLLRKEQDEGAFNKELAGLRENLSAIHAEIATYQAQMDTAREKETNRANAYASQLLSEAESEAKANAALLEAQALDIRAVNSAYFPEILEYRFQQETLATLEALADHLPQMVQVGSAAEQRLDYMAVARQMLGIATTSALYSEEEIERIRKRMDEIVARIKERADQISKLVADEQLQIAQQEENEDYGRAEAKLFED